MKYLLLASALFLIHDHNAPELDAWYKSLRSVAGYYCCDGSDAFSVLDPDWDTNDDPKTSDDWPYKVKVFLPLTKEKTAWILVNKINVVKDNNRAGIAKVWPVVDRTGVSIRCFLPGTLS